MQCSFSRMEKLEQAYYLQTWLYMYMYIFLIVCNGYYTFEGMDIIHIFACF